MLFLMYIMGYEFKPGVKLQGADLFRGNLENVIPTEATMPDGPKHSC